MANEGIDFELPKKIHKNSTLDRSWDNGIIFYTNTIITDTVRVSTRISGMY
jgi:hypothetical protein